MKTMTTQQKLTHEKYQEVLERLWRKLNTSVKINMQDFISKEKVSTNLWTVLTNQSIIKKTDIGYEWQGSYPDNRITSQVIQGIKNYKSTKKDKNKYRVTSEKTVIKYKEALKDLYFLLQYTSDISIDRFCSEKQIGKSLSGVLQNLEIVKYQNGNWTWIGNKPDSQMVDDIFEFRKRVKEQHSMHNSPFTKNELLVIENLTKSYNEFMNLSDLTDNQKTKFINGLDLFLETLKLRAFDKKHNSLDLK